MANDDSSLVPTADLVMALREVLASYGEVGVWLLGRIDDALAVRAQESPAERVSSDLPLYLDVLEDFLVIVPESLNRAEGLLTALNGGEPVEVQLLGEDSLPTNVFQPPALDEPASGFAVDELFGGATDGRGSWRTNWEVLMSIRAEYGLQH
jgi:hypothetical protein